MWYNSIMESLLKSPMHGVVSKNMMLISYTGRKSGQEFTTPVNYWQVSDRDTGLLLTTSKPDRVWWRNLRGGWPVVLQLCGKRINALGTLVEDVNEKERLFGVLFTQNPGIAGYFQVALDGNNQPVAEDIERTALQTILTSCVLSNA
jgi:hypothetical protein